MIANKVLTLLVSIFASRSNTSTLNHHFLLCILFDLGYRGLWFALKMNLESGPRFAGIWLIPVVNVVSFAAAVACSAKIWEKWKQLTRSRPVQTSYGRRTRVWVSVLIISRSGRDFQPLVGRHLARVKKTVAILKKNKNKFKYCST